MKIGQFINQAAKTGLMQTERMRVEPTKSGFWNYYEGRRSCGQMPGTPLSEMLRWIIEQINLGHVVLSPDSNGDIVSVAVGQCAASKVDSSDEAVELAQESLLALNVAGLIAEAREKGSSGKTLKFEQHVWDLENANVHWRMQTHYALVLTQLLGRVSKKLGKLEMLAIIDRAPARTKKYLAEATRCYLFKLDRACIAMCRACLEETLTTILTPGMRDEWLHEIESNKRKQRQPNTMHALIEVCSRNGILGNHKREAHYVREAGNRVLHSSGETETHENLAGEVLRKTRSIIGLIYADEGKESDDQA